MAHRDARGRDRVLHFAFVLLAAILGSGCNPLFGLHEGTARPICADPSTIDDMEDGEGSICESQGRHGHWYVVGDSTSTELGPGPGPGLEPTPIGDGERGTSRYAARFTGAGFTSWGALMGFNLNAQGASRQPYDASAVGGIKFWMKSTAAVTVSFLLPETVPLIYGGVCADGATDTNCDNHFSFQITAPSRDWAEYEVPFLALTQPGGSARWDPRHLLAIQFTVPLSLPPGAAFEVWVDDIRFYPCSTSGCTPTCTDPSFPVPCPSAGSSPAGCRPPGTDCAAVASWCADPLLIDDLEDDDSLICESSGRHGWWFTGGDGTSNDFSPRPEVDFTPTAIPGGRGPSRYAARLTGSGFTGGGALMGFELNHRGMTNQTYDASTASGIKFWMKSNVPAVIVGFPLPETIPISQTPGSVGTCDDSVSGRNCGEHFRFVLAASPDGWVEYKVPFAALRQGFRRDPNANLIAGSAVWDPSRLTEVFFQAAFYAFDVWVDDIRFYSCGTDTCAPTCANPDFPVACPASGGQPAACWPAGTGCANLPDLVNTVVWGSGPGDVWIAGVSSTTYAGAILHRDGQKWSASTSDTIPPIWGMWGSQGGDVWAVADHGTVLRRSGSAWSSTASGTDASLAGGVWGSGPDDVWAIAYPGTILRWQGFGWSATISRTDVALRHVWGSGASDVWAVGDKGTILHWDGAAWSADARGTASLLGIWGSGRDDVWAVGAGGAVIRWNGSAWAAVTSGTSHTLYGVWGSGPGGGVWAVGAKGTILFWDGSSWSAFPSGTVSDLYSVWGSGPSDVWAVGDRGTVRHWDGSSWTDSP